MDAEAQILDPELSPRSTVIASCIRMTTNPPEMNESNMASDVATSEDKMPVPIKEGVKDGNSNPSSSPQHGKDNSNPVKKKDTKENPEKLINQAEDLPPTPTPHEYPVSQIPGYPAILTPQGGSGYHYLSYNHMTPEPPSPAGPHAVTDVYNVGSFFQQPPGGAFAAPPHQSPFGIVTHGSAIPGSGMNGSSSSTPLSPPRGAMPTVNVQGNVPSSPLFPRPASGPGGFDGSARGAPPSPSIPYIMSPQQLGSNAVYHTYPAGGIGSRSSDDGAWLGGDRSQVNSYPSPQINGGMPMSYGATRANVGGRAYSFEDSMLPPAAVDQQDQANPAYSPYNTSQASPGGTLFTHPSWGYGAHPDMYNHPSSPLQPRTQAQVPIYPGMQPGAMRPMGPYGQYYPASSPGPPIQTTASNKGPDGANLFIFHIPNHFTNLDMYQLFSPYGNLLSVRIMVEKDTGRSRGFGFVSYDSPESAALAIKELNGFAIGNKRLKVQHKQIRSRDIHDRDSPQDPYNMGPHFASTLPPSGAPADPNMWPNGTEKEFHDHESGMEAKNQQHDECTEFTSTSTGAETPLMGGQNEQQSPLNTIGQMQSALPDIAGNDENNQ